MSNAESSPQAVQLTLQQALEQAMKHHQAGDLQEALRRYHAILQAEPNNPDANHKLGVLAAQLRQPEVALSFFKTALEALAVAGRYTEATTLAERMTGDFPFDATGWKALGGLLGQTGRSAEALEPMRTAARLSPTDAEVFSNLGNIHKSLGQLDEARSSYLSALEIDPDIAEVHYNLSNMCMYLGLLDEAQAGYRRALQIKPNFTEAQSNLLFSLNYTNQAATHYLEEARRYGLMAVEKVRVRFSSWDCQVSPPRLRVGLVSGDLCQHPVSHFLENVLAQIDPDHLELYAYPTNNKADKLTERIKPCFAAWKPLTGQTDEAAAQVIHADGVHILIDLSGHTADNRLPVFAWKPAPIQVSWLGYGASTGLEEMDYLIADSLVLPECEEAHFTERIMRLPETRWCFTPPEFEVPVSRLPALSNGYVTFACFNDLIKMNDEVVALWARVLNAVPGSRLLLKARQLNDPATRQNVIERFAAESVYSEQIILEGFAPRAEYLAAYVKADISLDPFPFTGGTTSVESLWMGVPVLTLVGERIVSRQGVGILTNAGLPEWIATDADDYVARAVAHAADLRRLATLRDELRQRVLVSPLFDAPRFARDFETALRGMWTQWCNQHRTQSSSPPIFQ